MNGKVGERLRKEDADARPVFQTSSSIGRMPINDKRQSAVFHTCRTARSRYTGAIAGSVPASTVGGMPARRFSLGKVNR